VTRRKTRLLAKGCANEKAILCGMASCYALLAMWCAVSASHPLAGVTLDQVKGISAWL